MAEAQQKATRASKAQEAKPAEAKAEAKAEVQEALEPPTTEPHDSSGPDPVPVERLMRDAFAFTGYPAHVLAGALSGDDRTTLTPDEARAACEAWLGAK